MELEKEMKPLKGKAYGSIPHLLGSRMGPADHHCHEGQSRIATKELRDRHDVVVVQEKLDGSCCAIARIEGAIVALTRAGYVAATSPYDQHHKFQEWVNNNLNRFEFLEEGERCVGEWLVQAHGTRYELPHEPFVLFDVMRKKVRVVYMELLHRVIPFEFITPKLLSYGMPMSVKEAMKRVKKSGHGAIDPVEGVVWRVERKGIVDYLVKYVRPDKVDGAYLESMTGEDPVMNPF